MSLHNQFFTFCAVGDVHGHLQMALSAIPGLKLRLEKFKPEH